MIRIKHSSHPRLFAFLLKIGENVPFVRKFLVGVCLKCGRWVGMNSVISVKGLLCERCAWKIAKGK